MYNSAAISLTFSTNNNIHLSGEECNLASSPSPSSPAAISNLTEKNAIQRPSLSVSPPAIILENSQSASCSSLDPESSFFSGICLSAFN